MKRSRVCGLLCAVSALAISAQAHAQAGGAVDDTRLAEIVVTAQKREQALHDVPLSISAIGQEELVRRGASTINDLQYGVPGLSITEFAPGQQRVQMRGVSVYNGLPTIGVYLDEMPLNTENNQSGQDVRLLDIRRVEVLRGPQGTLYGQGAVGGTLRYITNDVDLQSAGGSASAELGAVSGGGTDWKADGVVNAPLVNDRLGVRLAGGYQRFGGFIDNPRLGETNVNAGHALTVRGKVAMKFSDDFKLTVMAQHQELKLGAQNLADGDQAVFDALPTPVRSQATLLSATATYDLGFAQLLSASGFIDRRDDLVQDLTATFTPFLPFLGVPAGAVRSIGLSARSNSQIFTQEVRLASQGDGAFGWTVGGFYRNSQSDGVGGSLVTPNVIPPGVTLYAFKGTSPSNSRSWAVFGEASYAIAPTLTALVGLRYFEDRRVQDTTSTIFNAPAVDRGRETFTALSPRFNLAWQPNAQWSLYANVAKGFRSGGFNLTSSGAGLGTVPPTYDPDKIWTYEAGGKFRSSGGAVAGELAVYRNVWDGVQTTTNIPGLPTNFTTNGGKVAGWGVDGSFSYTPVRALTFSLSGGWNNMEYKSRSVEHLEGDRADYVPRFTGSASAEYRFDVATLPSYLRVDYQYADRFQVFMRNFQATPARSDIQKILNARLGVQAKGWTGSIFARNILNRDSVIYPAFAALIYPARLQPRVIGAAISVNF
ncbi:TonB-dependent receptor [uncultured Caulobacter sp.]|uniref:TonB-dependent receptor n=1 Tax=uncultured Caulobacter sp. TaxID=158749 RepID=UPI002601D09B|nr:TonB-dependent receptor [uncultured Caulobacter sp.]